MNETIVYAASEQTAWATALGGLSAALTGLVAIFALIAATNDSRKRTRPVVVAELRSHPDPRAIGWLILAVRNVGATTARDLTVTFTPALTTSEKNPRLVEFLKQRYDETIPSLGPGQELVNTVQMDAKDPAESDIPPDVTVEVTYRRSAFRSYHEVYPLRAAVLLAHTRVTITSPGKSIKASIDSLTGVMSSWKDA